MIVQVWQAFVGVRARRLKRYYLDLLDPESDTGDGQEHDRSSLAEDYQRRSKESIHVPEKLRKQIEKVIRCMGPGLYRSVFSICRCYFFLGSVLVGHSTIL